MEMMMTTIAMTSEDGVEECREHARSVIAGDVTTAVNLYCVGQLSQTFVTTAFILGTVLHGAWNADHPNDLLPDGNTAAVELGRQAIRRAYGGVVAPLTSTALERPAPRILARPGPLEHVRGSRVASHRKPVGGQEHPNDRRR